MALSQTSGQLVIVVERRQGRDCKILQGVRRAGAQGSIVVMTADRVA